MIKRIISLLLAICMVISFIPSTVLAAIVNNDDAIAMYRLYNPNSGEHFYTGSVEERDNLESLGWNYEGIGWYAPRNSGENIHRFFNPNTGDHHYTASPVEMADLKAAGWQYEGIAWNSKGDFPQYRLFNPNAVSGMHHYTGSEEERDYLVSLGWHYEGIAWYGIDPMKFVEDQEPTDPGVDSVAVSFYDGDRLIDTLQTQKDAPLGVVPSVEKSSKDNAILLGYFTDKECTTPFYADAPIAEDTVVYAKYETMGAVEELTFTSFAQMDQSPDLSFTIRKVSGDVAPADAVTLRVMDGSDPVELSIVGSDSTYTVKAVNGFNEGASYQLDLADGWIFDGKPDSIRTASFSIDMEEVENLQMSDHIIYIKDTDAIKYTVGTVSHDVLTSELITENGGNFSWDGAQDLEAGDLLCIYVGKHPDQRENNADVLDPAVYVKVKAVEGNTVTFRQLTSEDQQELYDVPDNFPIIVEALPTEATGKVNLNALDLDMYKTMMGEEDGTMDAAKAGIAVGDFVTLYVSKDSIESAESLYYGQISGYDAETGEITYKQTTRQAILDSMDLYANVNLQGSDFITDEEIEELEAMLQAQVEQSDFAEDAAYLLADMISKTDGFRNNMTVQDVLLTDEYGNPLTEEQIELLNLGGSFELTDDIKLTVELINKGDQLHFDGGVQLAIGVDAEFEVELESEDKIAIDMSATFVQEVTIDPRVKGKIVYKEILWIPVPIGVKVGATVDIQSFTALSFEAEIYTVEAEDASTWDKLKSIAENPAEVLDMADLPDELVKGLNTVGDVMDKINELEDLATKCTEKNEQYMGYVEDAQNLWAVVEESGLTSKEDWEAMGEALGQTSVTSDLLEMMDMTTETGLSTEYYDSMQALMERYCEMVEKETDWITLVEQEIFVVEVNVCGLVIGVEASFVVRADLSLAIGSNLQYQVGKRYEFWFKIGLFKPSAGSSTMDLIDEQFAFQFYVMGRLGVKAGVKAKLYVGIGTGKLASVGITAELGPYLKLYGFFVYEYTKYRPANTNNWISNERMAGALFMEFGLYFIMGFEAEALGLFEYSHEFVDEEIPLLTAGDARYYYMFDYEPEEGEMVVVRDEDSDGTNGITMQLPTELLNMAFVDLNTGLMGYESLDYKNYIFTLSNPNFTYDAKSGQINVNIPENTRYMECDLIATYKYGKMAFSKYDMTVTIPLVWTNLATAELNEFYTASVRAGNAKDGFDTVWTKRILKNKQFDLPSAKDLNEIVGWNDYKHTAGTGYGDQQTTGLTIIDNKAYDYDMGLKTYALTVTDIQNADGTTCSKTFYAKYGESFDFSSLAGTGTSSNGVYTKFSQLTANKDIDLSRTVNASFADAINGGLTVKANYVDNSVTATFAFTGLDHEDVSVKLRRGTAPSIAQIEAIAADAGMAVKDIYPAIGNIEGSTTYQVIIGELTGPEATITFEENDGSEVADITKVIGSLIGDLPETQREGYTFGGWYTDNETFANAFEATKMAEGGATVYAKWTANQYTVTFHVNGGNALDAENETKTVTYDAAYGELPVPERTGYGFQGWFTAETDGEKVTAETVCALNADQTLYAQWKILKEIPRTVFDFGEAEEFTYETGVTRDVVYTFTAEEGETYQAEDFTIKFMRQGNTEYETGLPVNAGTYNVTISRPADADYAKFEQTYTDVLVIKKAVREEWTVLTEQVDCGYTWIELKLGNMTAPAPGLPDVVDGGIPDLSPDAQIIFNIYYYDDVYSSDPVPYTPGATSGVVRDLPYTPSAGLDSSVTVIDPNYEDWTSNNDLSDSFHMADLPTDKWTDDGNYDISWYNAEATEFTISTPAQFAGVSYLVNSGTDSFNGDTITLTADIDLRGHEWVPVGYNNYFTGMFDGGNHTISGVCVEESGTTGVSLFGNIRSEILISDYTIDGSTVTPIATGGYCVIENIVLDDAYFSGKYEVGGIASYATASFPGTWSSLSSYFGKTVIIDNCVSYAEVSAGTDGDDNSEAGGILGHSASSHALVMNCVNYGNISGAQMRIGGIVGYLSYGGVTNCANFGDITGHSRLGGIVGTQESGGWTRNCYNLGYVVSARSNKYIGSICGRNVDDDGTVQNNYYKWGNAYGKNGEFRYALGNDGGSVKDGNKDYIASSFSYPNSKMSSAAGDFAGMTLIDALNKYVAEVSTTTDVIWVAGADGWPIPTTNVASSLRK